MNIKPLHAYVTDGARYAVLRGPVRPLLAELGIVGTYAPIDRGYAVRAEHVPDILALADSQRGQWKTRVHRIEVHP